MSFIDKLRPLLTRVQGVSIKPGTGKYHPLIISIILGLMFADLGILYVRPLMIPSEAPPLPPSQQKKNKMTFISEYDVITRRNIFNEDGKIAPPFGATEEDNGSLDRPPVLSQLPIQLLGTIVHLNPKYSIATVSLTSKSISASFKVDEEIDGIAKITKIERKRVVFINLSIHRPEYIEIPEDANLSFGLQAGTASTKPTGLVEQKGKFDFNVKRTDFEALVSNLPAVLQQARMEPAYSPDGVGIEGFRFVSIQPGSPFEKLGFKVNDTINSVNGESVNSPTKAMEMFNLLRSSNNVQLGFVRDGRTETMNYTIQ